MYSVWQTSNITIFNTGHGKFIELVSSNTAPSAHASWAPPLSCNSLQVYPSSIGVFFPSSDSGMTEINGNKLLISIPKSRKRRQTYKVAHTYNVIPHVFLANMTVKECRRYATVSWCWHFLCNILKEEKMQCEFKHIHLFKKNYKIYELWCFLLNMYFPYIPVLNVSYLRHAIYSVKFLALFNFTISLTNINRLIEKIFLWQFITIYFVKTISSLVHWNLQQWKHQALIRHKKEQSDSKTPNIQHFRKQISFYNLHISNLRHCTVFYNWTNDTRNLY